MHNLINANHVSNTQTRSHTEHAINVPGIAVAAVVEEVFCAFSMNYILSKDFLIAFHWFSVCYVCVCREYILCSFVIHRSL